MFPESGKPSFISVSSRHGAQISRTPRSIYLFQPHRERCWLCFISCRSFRFIHLRPSHLACSYVVPHEASPLARLVAHRSVVFPEHVLWKKSCRSGRLHFFVSTTICAALVAAPALSVGCFWRMCTICSPGPPLSCCPIFKSSAEPPRIQICHSSSGISRDVFCFLTLMFRFDFFLCAVLFFTALMMSVMKSSQRAQGLCFGSDAASPRRDTNPGHLYGRRPKIRARSLSEVSFDSRLRQKAQAGLLFEKCFKHALVARCTSSLL